MYLYIEGANLQMIIKQLPKLLLIALLIVSSMTVSSVLAQDSVECGDVIEAELDGDPMSFEVSVDDEVLLSISLQSEDFDTLIEVYEDGELIASDDDGGEGLNSYLLLTESGEFEIVVTSFSGSAEGDFELRVNCAGGCEVYDRELSNDDPEHLDFSAEEGDKILILAYSEEFDTLVNLLDANNNVIASDDDSAFGLNSLLIFDIEDDGDYFAEVTSFSGDSEGDFNVIICEDAGDVSPADGSAVNYIYLECGDTQTGTIDDDFPIVFFYYDGEAGDEITVTLSADGGDLDTYLAFFTQESAQTDETVAENDDADGTDSELTYELEDDGLMIIAATRYEFAEGTTSGDFEIELACS